MKAHVQFVQTSPNDLLEKMVRDRLLKLKQKYDWIIQANVILKREEASAERNRRCSVELSVPGENVFQDCSAESFERAIVDSFDTLDRQLRKHKSKLYPHL